MFGTIVQFLLLIAFACIITGGVITGRKFLQLVHVRGDTELAKAKVQREQILHTLHVDTHQNKLKLLALTDGGSKSAEKKDQEWPEEVRVRSRDIQTPFEPYNEYRETQRMQEAAVDAEIEPIPVNPFPVTH